MRNQMLFFIFDAFLILEGLWKTDPIDLASGTVSGAEHHHDILEGDFFVVFVLIYIVMQFVL